jgi:hypothetical protein
MQRLRASLTRLEYDARRDFVGFGADGVDIVEFKTETLLAAGSPSWKFLPATAVAETDDTWLRSEHDDRKWRTGKTPVGYGEEEIATRGGTTISEEGQALVFRHAVNIPAAALGKKGTIYQLSVAADNAAVVYINGQPVVEEGEDDHEFSYWNQVIDVEPSRLKAGRNVIAAHVSNTEGSSDLYFDLQLAAETPIIAKPVAPPKIATNKTTPSTASQSPANSNPQTVKPSESASPVVEVTVDKTRRLLTVPCRIAARKLPNLSEVYPLEVIATAPPPKGRKAHETVITTQVTPSQLHAAMESLGLNPGEPAKGEEAKASGPEVALYLQFADSTGKIKTYTIENVLVDTKSNKPLPPRKWHFTGSVSRRPDPELEETVYAADLSGTLIAIFPVTNEMVFQSDLTLADEPSLKLETNKKILPAEGSAASLIIKVK